MCGKINNRNFTRRRKTNETNETNETNDFTSKESKVEDRSLGMYNNSSDREMCRCEERQSDRIVQTISRSYIEDKSYRLKDSAERNSNARDVRKEWTHVEYVIDDTLNLLEGTNAPGEKGPSIGEKHGENHGGARRILRNSNLYRSRPQDRWDP